MEIREAAVEDLLRIVELFCQLGYSTDTNQVRKQLDELRQSASGEAFVATVSGAVVGVVTVHVMTPLHADTRWALLSALVVDDNRRSLGVGAHLMRRVEAFAMERGCSQLELSSSVVRTRAHAFYVKNGYKEKRVRFLKVFPEPPQLDAASGSPKPDT